MTRAAPLFRIWSEHLPFADARQGDVLDLLAHGGIHPIFAVPADADLDALVALIGDLRARRLSVGVWPLLSEADGYWPSERNGDAYFDRAKAILDHLEQARATPAWIAVDLEPPLDQMTRLLRSRVALPAVARQLWRANRDPVRFEQAAARFVQGAQTLHERGIETLGVTLPLAAHDLRDGLPLWQDLLEAPWQAVPWHRAGIMAYSSMVAGYSQGLVTLEDARFLHYRLFRHLVRAFGRRAHASVGVTGAGKLGDEPAYAGPEELAADVAVAQAAGIDDIAIFCLEGVLARAEPGRWIDAAINVAPYRPRPTVRAGLIRTGGSLVRSLLKAFG